MIQLEIQTVDELRQALSAFGEDALFRGQTCQYGPDGSPRMNTSFSRNGCIPPLMLRWSHYARFILAALLGQHEREIGIEFTQAILQHYGWRSFYIDASSSSRVAAWFAAHTFESSMKLELCEDCFEDAVFLKKRSARYNFEEGQGFVYALSREALTMHHLQCHDLSSIEFQNCRPRFYAQRAWLVGVLHNDLPIQCVVASIKGPRRAFRDFASTGGLNETSDVFPSANEDPVMKLLMTLPWKKIPMSEDSGPQMDFYQQAIEIPEYDDSFTKHNPSCVAFYKSVRAIEYLPESDFDFFDVPDDIIFGSADGGSMRFPKVAELVRQSPRHVVFEVDNLIRQPGQLTSEYVKGVSVTRCDDGTFCVADFVVDHPGQRLVGCGINMGWHYEVAENGMWHRIPSDDDCPCANRSRHEHHLSALEIVESRLAGNSSDIVKQRSSASQPAPGRASP